MTNAMHGVTASLRELIALRERIGGPLHGAPIQPSPGKHAAAHRSRGMEFAETRPYQPGDDVRSIDWRQSARRGRVYTKLYQEEHERPVRLLIDVGPSMRFGTRVAFKSVAAARAAATLAWMADAAGDRVGGVVWDGNAYQDIAASGQHTGVLKLLRCVADATVAAPLSLPPDAAVDMAKPLRALARTLRPGSLVVLISDFATLHAGLEKDILALGRRAELVLLQVYDAFEAEAPPPGQYRVTDGTHYATLDLQTSAARHAYGEAFAQRCSALQMLARRSGARLLPLPTHGTPDILFQAAFPDWARRA